MIQIYSKLKVADNSGAREIMCIQVRGSSKRRYAYVGDVIMASVKKALPEAAIKKGEVVRAVVVRTRYPIKRDDGTVVRFDENSAVLINEEGEPRGAELRGRVRPALCER